MRVFILVKKIESGCICLVFDKMILQQECIPVGCVPSAAVTVSGGWVSRGVCVCPGGVHPPVNRITDRCKNITFPQLRLRTIINKCIRLE